MELLSLEASHKQKWEGVWMPSRFLWTWCFGRDRLHLSRCIVSGQLVVVAFMHLWGRQHVSLAGERQLCTSSAFLEAGCGQKGLQKLKVTKWKLFCCWLGWEDSANLCMWCSGRSVGLELVVQVKSWLDHSTLSKFLNIFKSQSSHLWNGNSDSFSCCTVAKDKWDLACQSPGTGCAS
jgi:hypothetical protein